MVNSWYDPAEGEVLAFEEQIGSHGGLGGAQGHALPARPRWPCRRRSTRARNWSGAEQVHHVLRRWLREGDGPQVPLDESRHEPAPDASFTAATVTPQDDSA